jgi:nucleotide-binding universal stress UspA family protein
VNVRLDGTVERRGLADAVAERLTSRSVDLLVLGVEPGPARHGRLGDTVESIVGGAPCATLLVHPQA